MMTSETYAKYGLPETYKALLFTSNTSPPSITALPTPLPTAGTAIIKPLLSFVPHYIRDIFTNGNPRGYRYVLPMVPGSSTIARIVNVASDAPTLKPDQLVWIDPVVRARDRSGQILHGLHGGQTDQSWALMENEWRNGSWGELAKVPAENVHMLDESLLLRSKEDGGMGYKLEDLSYLSSLMVAYGGLRDVDLAPGETILIAPSTGPFGGSAVHVALSMGARVIAMGRNDAVLTGLKALDPGRITVVKMSGDVETDKTNIITAAHGKPVDVYFDMSPPTASQSAHIKAGILALRPKGRMSLMGGAAGDVGFPYYQIMAKGLRLQGTFMYTSDQAVGLIKLLESGVLRIGEERDIMCEGIFGLHEWSEAFEAAWKKGNRIGRFVLMAPNKA